MPGQRPSSVRLAAAVVMIPSDSDWVRLSGFAIKGGDGHILPVKPSDSPGDGAAD